MAVKTARKNTTAPRDSGRYLDRLGERVRRLRNQRGMTRKALAQHAEVSERYLAQLESGEGNCSIVLLRRIAHAIGGFIACTCITLGLLGGVKLLAAWLAGW